MTDKENIKELSDFMLKVSNSAAVEPVFELDDGEEIMLGDDVAKIIDAILEQAFIPYLAKALYDAGYRKIANTTPVKQGEWLCDYNQDTRTTTVTCSNCKDSREIKGCYVGIHDEPLYNEDDFCPNCGADMRGVNLNE